MTNTEYSEELDGPILTDAQGRPFKRPEKPALFASMQERIDYLTAMYAYKDAVASCANQAFARGFATNARPRNSKT